MTQVLARHGNAHRDITWVSLTPLAAPVLRAAADALADTDVALTWYDPDAGAHMTRRCRAGQIQAHEYRTTKSITGTGFRLGETAIRKMDAATPGNSGRATISQYIALAQGSATAIDRLRLAADLLDMGHDVLVYATDAAFHVQLDTANCACPICAHVTIAA